jgi:hypothetical protein
VKRKFEKNILNLGVRFYIRNSGHHKVTRTSTTGGLVETPHHNKAASVAADLVDDLNDYY